METVDTHRAGHTAGSTTTTEDQPQGESHGPPMVNPGNPLFWFIAVPLLAAPGVAAVHLWQWLTGG